MGYIYIYKYVSQKVAICSLWTVCPCLIMNYTIKDHFALLLFVYLCLLECMSDQVQKVFLMKIKPGYSKC